jgi:hypothetical protein
MTKELLTLEGELRTKVNELEAQLAAIREAFLERYQDLKGASP